MTRVYHISSDEVREVDSVDARELVETGRWSESPTVASYSTDDKGAVLGDSDSAPCLLTVLELRAALKLAGVSMPHGASKSDLVALYEAANPQGVN